MFQCWHLYSTLRVESSETKEEVVVLEEAAAEEAGSKRFGFNPVFEPKPQTANRSKKAGATQLYPQREIKQASQNVEIIF